MKVAGEYFAGARNRDAGSLFDGKRMVCGLERDEGPLTMISQVHHRLEVLGLRVAPERGREPTEEWPGVRTMLFGMHLDEHVEVLAAQRHPDTPDEGVRVSKDRNFEATSNEEELFVDDTDIGVKAATSSPLTLRN